MANGSIAPALTPSRQLAAGWSAQARSVQSFLGSGSLRADKPVPDFVDRLGWCTWDAFYMEVSAEKVLAGLASFEAAGVAPRVVIVDDGWQTWQRAASGEGRLVSFAPNPAFGGDLGPLIDAAKTRCSRRSTATAMRRSWASSMPVSARARSPASKRRTTFQASIGQACVAWADKAPAAMRWGDEPVAFTHDRTTAPPAGCSPICRSARRARSKSGGTKTVPKA